MSITDTMPEDRRSRRKAESLPRIKTAARKLFVERGYHATRPQDIAREAGLGHGTFYLYYPDKRACFLAFVDDARRELDVHLSAVRIDRKSTRLNSSHSSISYAVFCLKKK